MRILTVSDVVLPELAERFDDERFQKVDLILSCGDLPPEYLTLLLARFRVPLYYVRGNHDIRHDGYQPDGGVDLDEELIWFRGIRLMGLEGSSWYNGRPHQYTERQMRRKVRRLRFRLWRMGGVDIVITHAPPRHIHDADSPSHRGFQCYRKLIERYQPRYFIHGHMHFNYTAHPRRMTEVNRTRVINSYGYYLFDIETGPAD